MESLVFVSMTDPNNANVRCDDKKKHAIEIKRYKVMIKINFIEMIALWTLIKN